MRLLAFVTFPVFFGVSAVAPWITSVAFGPKWGDAAAPLAILAIAMASRPIGLLVSPFLVSIGHFVASLKNTVFSSILFPTAFLIGSYWGLFGIGVAWLIACPLQLFSLLRQVARVTNTPIMLLIQPLLAPLAGSLIMYISVHIIEAMLSSSVNQLNSLFFLTIAGVVIYFSYSLLFLRHFFSEFLNLVRR